MEPGSHRMTPSNVTGDRNHCEALVPSDANCRGLAVNRPRTDKGFEPIPNETSSRTHRVQRL